MRGNKYYSEKDFELMKIVVKVLIEADVDQKCDLYQIFGSITADEVIKLERKINMENYCTERNLKFEKLTEDDIDDYCDYEMGRLEVESYRNYQEYLDSLEY